MMQLFKSFKSFFRRKRNRDRVYVYDPDLDYYNKSWFLKFYSALGCINLPKREKYNPDYFTDIFSSSTTNNTTCSQHDNFQKQGTTDRGYMETEIVNLIFNLTLLQNDILQWNRLISPCVGYVKTAHQHQILNE